MNKEKGMKEEWNRGETSEVEEKYNIKMEENESRIK